MNLRGAGIFGIACCAAVLTCAEAFGFIDARFTPVDLVKQSEVVFTASLTRGADGDTRSAGRVEDLKGKTAPFSISVANAKESERDDVRKLFEANGAEPVIFFAAKTNGYMHVDGQWLAVTRNVGGAWEVTARAPKLTGTWAGGTDTLIRLARYVLDDPDATVPVSVGMGWVDMQAELGKLDAPPAGLATVELPGGDLCVFVALASGDRLFRATKDDETFEEITAKVKLATRSKRFAWTDLDADGRIDLASWDGKELSLWRLSKAGTFERADAGKGFALKECLGLAPCALHKDGTPALLVSTTSFPFPFLLHRDKAGAWVSTALGTVLDSLLGPTSFPCIVGDIDGDGWWDVLQPRRGMGLLWRGSATGLKPNEDSAVKLAGSVGRFALGDFDGDGSLDVFLSDDKTSTLWANDGKGTFRNVTSSGGSLAYRLPAGASDCVATDLNHDGRADLCLLYPKEAMLYHFNRGFRCFGEEGELRLIGGEEGVHACAVGDFNADGSLDLVVALADGRLRCYYNSAFEKPVLRVSFAKGAPVPLKVSAWQGDEHPVCIGTSGVGALPLRTNFTVRTRDACTLRWRAADGTERTKVIPIPAQLTGRGIDVLIEP